MTGKIILIEGTDKCGKEKQTKMLVERLDKEIFPGAKRMSFPRYETPTGKKVKEYLNGKYGDPDKVNPRFASRLYANDRKAAEKEMREIINSDKHLILDRYVESNMGHQGGKAKTIEERDKIINFIDKLEYEVLGLPKPNLTIFLYRPYEHILESLKKEGEIDGHESNPGHLMRAEKTYLYLAEKCGWKKINCNKLGNWRTPKDIHEEVYKYVLPLIKQ